MIPELAKRPRPAPAGALPVAAAPDIASLAGALPDVTSAPNDWYPLGVGNEWTYAVVGSGAQSQYTIKVAGAFKAGEATVYRALTSIGSGAPIPCQMLTAADGLWRRNRPATADSPWKREYLTTLSGDNPAARDGCTYTLLPPEHVETPCGTFTDVLRIRKRSERYTLDLWFARHVGLVRTACAETGVTETLVRFHAGEISGGSR
jgi:hypothetical protein